MNGALEMADQVRSTETGSVLSEKLLLRKKARIQAKKWSEQEEKRAEYSSRLVRRVAEWFPFQSSGKIGLFLSTGTEPDTDALLNEAFRSGKRVFVPVTFENGQMLMSEVFPGDSFETGAFGIRVPCAVRITEESPELLFVPCLLAGCDGTRLGHGGGYYDRYLSGWRKEEKADRTHSTQFAVILTFSEFVSSHIPSEEHDEKADYIITEQEIIDCKAREASN